MDRSARQTVNWIKEAVQIGHTDNAVAIALAVRKVVPQVGAVDADALACGQCIPRAVSQHMR